MTLFRSALISATLLGGLLASAQTSRQPISAPVEGNLARLSGNTHPLATAANDRGPVAPELRLDRVRLVLRRTPERQAALDALTERLYDPKSPDFHKFLSPDEFGKTYGISDSELERVKGWLTSHGLTVTSVDRGRNFLQFSGTVTQVNETFSIEMHQYLADGKLHIANDRDPQIPADLLPSVAGVASLHDFFPRPQHVNGGNVTRDPKTGKFLRTSTAPQSSSVGKLQPKGQLSYGDDYGQAEADLTPYDFATIYNVLPLWKAGITGKGQTIAISATTDINISDVSTFRSAFGLPANNPVVIHNGADPGITDADSQGENTLDVEWSGAVAYAATVYLVVSKNTSTTFGGDLSNEYIVDNKVSPVTSASYGTCEIELGTAGNTANLDLYQQAAAEGIAAFESAGDQGSAGCDGHGGTPPYGAENGIAVNGDASTPFETAVGGTDLNWFGKFDTYWSETNNSTTGESALGYIPEVPWNSTCASPFVEQQFNTDDPTLEAFCNDAATDPDYDVLVNIAAGSGGVSSCISSDGSTFASCKGGYAKPSWQSGTGVPNDGVRDLPDVSLFASGGVGGPYDVGSAYIYCVTSAQGASSCDYSTVDGLQMQLVGGTSVSSPAMAGVMALVNQKVGTAQGFANPVMYQLFRNENASSCGTNSVTNSGSCVFNDITQGNIQQACAAGHRDCSPQTSGDAFGILACCTSTVGYDEATGLGSVNVYNLATKWAALAASEVATTTTLTISPNPATINGSVNLSATVKKSSGSGTPTGSVTFSLSGTTLSTVTLSNGTAAQNGLKFSSAGTFPITATYSGDSSDKSSSTTVNLTVSSGTSKVNTTTTLTATPNPIVVNAVGTLSATVKKSSGSGTPTGTVTFYYGTLAIASASVNGSGVASARAQAAVPAGTYPLFAKYNGDGSDNASTSNTVNEVVKNASLAATTTTASASPNPVKSGSTTGVTVHVTGGTTTPGGTITFTYNGAVFGTASLSNGFAATGFTVSLPAGSYTVNIGYGGDSTHAASSTTLKITVD